MTKRVVMIVTNTNKMSSKETGLWLSEFVETATEMQQAGIEIVAVSPEGGRIPIDPDSYSNELPRLWDGVMEPIHDTAKISDVNPTDFDGIFLCGGHGAMVDFPNNEALKQLLLHFLTEKKVIGSVCHGAAGFVGVKNHNREYLVRGITLTGFTNEEEKQTESDAEVPFMLEDRLKEEGAIFQSGPAFESHVEVDGDFVTGQNPKSSLQTAQAMIEQLKNR